MKVLYFLAANCTVLMFVLLYMVQQDKENIVERYSKKCEVVGGETYVVENPQSDKVILCLNTDLFLLMPSKLEKQRKSASSKNRSKDTDEKEDNAGLAE